MKKIYGYFILGGAVGLLALALVPLLSAEERPTMTVAQAREALKEAHEAEMAENADRAIELLENILKAYPNGFEAAFPENLHELMRKGDLKAIRQAQERGECLDLSARAKLASVYWYLKHDAVKATATAEKALQEVPDSQTMRVILRRARAALAAKGQAPGPPPRMTLEEARGMVRQALEARQRGDPKEAVRLARMVLERHGDVEVRWPLEGAVHPAGFDLYAPPEEQIRIITEARLRGEKAILRFSGTSALAELLYALFESGDYRAAAAMAEELLNTALDDEVFFGPLPGLLRECRKKLQEQAQALEPLVILAADREASPASESSPPRVGPNEIQAGCTTTPVRDWANRLNFRLTWNEREGAAFLVGPDFAAQVRPQEKEALVNGRRVDLPVAPYLRRGRLMLPLRFLADLLKAQVDWTGATRIAYVILPAPSPGGTG